MGRAGATDPVPVIVERCRYVGPMNGAELPGKSRALISPEIQVGRCLAQRRLAFDLRDRAAAESGVGQDLRLDQIGRLSSDVGFSPSKFGGDYGCRPTHRLDEFPAGYSLAGCAPAEPASASPAGHQYAVQSFCRSRTFQQTANSVLTANMGLRPAKLHENESELRTIERYRSGEVGQTVEKSRLFNCLIRSVRD